MKTPISFLDKCQLFCADLLMKTFTCPVAWILQVGTQWTIFYAISCDLHTTME